MLKNFPVENIFFFLLLLGAECYQIYIKQDCLHSNPCIWTTTI